MQDAFMTDGSAGETSFSIVCLSSQEWHVPLPTNRQQIMSRAAARGHRVLFVETGHFVLRHLWRLRSRHGRGSLLRRLTVGEEVAPGIVVQKLPNVFPLGQRHARINRLNWRIGTFFLRLRARRLPEPRVLWLYDPAGVAAIGSFGETFSVYDCVDDYAEQSADVPRSKAFVARADAAAAAGSRVVFATTRPLYERQLALNRKTHLVPNVGDYAHFAVGADRAAATEDLAALPRPVIGFAGNLTRAKVDFDLLLEVARAFPSATVLLAGPVEETARAGLERVTSLANVRWLGLQSYEALPRVVAAFDVALIPYVSTEYTRSCFPLKLYEYLAAGKRVVASGLPALAGLEPHVTLTDGSDEFVAAVERALELGDAGHEERQRLAAGNTWDSRASRLLELVAEELAASA